MAGELTINATYAYDDGVSSPVSLQLSDFVANITTRITARHQQTIAITDTALNLGGLTSLGYYLIFNLDTTNYITLKHASAGQRVGILWPGGGPAMGYFGPDMQAPYLIASIAPCIIDVLLVSP